MLCLSFAWEDMCACSSIHRAAGGGAKAWLHVWAVKKCWLLILHLFSWPCCPKTYSPPAGFSMEVLWHLEKAFLSSPRVRGAVSGRDHTGEILKGAGQSSLRCYCLPPVLACSSFWGLQEWPYLYLSLEILPPQCTQFTLTLAGASFLQAMRKVHSFYQNCPSCCQQSGLSTSLLVTSE